MAVDKNIKEQLHQLVEAIDNEEQLNILHEAAAAYVSEQDILDNLSAAEIKSLQTAKQQIADGQYFTREQVAEKIDLLLANHTK